MRSYTYNRYLWLLNTLLIYKRLTFEELCNKWECSSMYEGEPLNLRTFHTHRNAVEEMFHISIKCDTSDGYRYYIEESASLTKDKFRQWLLNSFNVVDLVRCGQAMQSRILLENILAGTEYISRVIEAMQKNKVMVMEYQPFYEDAPSVYHVQPYCMKVYHQRWYVLAFFEESGGLRHFALDRTVSLEVTDAVFKYPKTFSPDDYYNDTVGIWVNDKVKAETVVVRAYGVQAKYMKTLPLHHSQQEIKVTDEYTDFRYHLCVTCDLVSELFRKGNTIEVLKPDSLRKQIFDAALAVVKRYSKKQ